MGYLKQRNAQLQETFGLKRVLSFVNILLVSISTEFIAFNGKNVDALEF